MQSQYSEKLKAGFTTLLQETLPQFKEIQSISREDSVFAYRAEEQSKTYFIQLAHHLFYDGYTLNIGLNEDDYWPRHAFPESTLPTDEHVDGGLVFRINKLWNPNNSQEFWWWIGGDPRSQNLALDPLAMLASIGTPDSQIADALADTRSKVEAHLVPYFDEVFEKVAK